MSNELNRNDRCDRCNASALVRVMIGELPLDFCGHHYREHKTKLEEIGAEVAVDNTVEKTEKELASV